MVLSYPLPPWSIANAEGTAECFGYPGDNKRGLAKSLFLRESRRMIVSLDTLGRSYSAVKP